MQALRFRRASDLARTLCLLALAGPALAAPDIHVHQAQPGDTLIALGQRYLTRPDDWRQLQQINQIRDPRRIPVGQRIKMPVKLLRATAASAQVLSVAGQATVHAGDKALPVVAGMAWTPGSDIRTTNNGYVTVKLADGSTLRIQSDSQVRLNETRHYEAPGFFASVLEVIKGRVEAAVAHVTGGEPRFQIKTPQATLGVRGTDFRVATNEDTATSRGEVLTGRVEVQGREHTRGVGLQAGQGTLVDATQQVTPPSPLPPPPDLSGVSPLHERPLVRLTVPVVTGATYYRAQVALDPQFQQVRGEVTSPTPELRLQGLDDGTYHLRVRAGNALGLEGPDAIRTFELHARPEPPQTVSPPPRGKHRGIDTTLQWTEAADSARHRLQLTRQADWAQPEVDVVLRQAQHTLRLTDGVWRWRLASITASGRQGPWSDAQTFQKLPPPADVPMPTVSETTLDFTWPAEPGQTHLFQMARDPQFTQQITSLRTAEAQASLPRPQAGGRWWVRIQSTDADGYVGPFSTPQKLELAACLQDSQGRCLTSGDGRMVRERP